MTENNTEISKITDSPDISMSVNRNLKQPVAPAKPVREIDAVIFFDRLDPDAEENLYDFRPTNDIDEDIEEEEVVAPKVLSAQELADSLGVSEEELSQETPAPAEKDSGQPKDESPGVPTS